jgi:hypothetical protein
VLLRQAATLLLLLLLLWRRQITAVQLLQVLLQYFHQQCSQHLHSQHPQLQAQCGQTCSNQLQLPCQQPQQLLLPLLLLQLKMGLRLIMANLKLPHQRLLLLLLLCQLTEQPLLFQAGWLGQREWQRHGSVHLLLHLHVQGLQQAQGSQQLQSAQQQQTRQCQQQQTQQQQTQQCQQHLHVRGLWQAKALPGSHQ